MSYTFPEQFPVTCHTDFVGKGSTFVAIKGSSFDGVTFIEKAIDLGATTVVIQNDVVLSDTLQEKIENVGVQLKKVENARKALATLSAESLGYPASQLNIIGITGTKGKTTTAFLVEHIMRTAGYTTALISTVGNKIGDYSLPKNLTTPQPDYLQVFLAECLRLGVEWVVMEVSAQALTLDRVCGIQFAGVIFTNFSQEHAEFYASQEEYFKAKCLIFKQLRPEAPSIINADDPWYDRLAWFVNDMLHSSTISFLRKDVTIPAVLEKNSFHEGIVVALEKTQEAYLCTRLIGVFNAYNILMAASLARALGIPYSTINSALESFGSVPGRMQQHVLANGALAIIDYAHTPSSFESVLSTLRHITDRLIVVFGAGGNRDKEKRPLMGALAATYADIVIVTTDNPRNENPDDIIHAIVEGIQPELYDKVIIEVDREAAIKKAYQLSHAQSIIALLGKGPDEYQEIKGIKTPFSERTILSLLQ